MLDPLADVSPTIPSLSCPTCFGDMVITVAGVIFELGVDVNFRRWICDAGHTCEQQWMVTK